MRRPPPCDLRTPAELLRRLLADPGIVRNRAKIASAIGNARTTLEVTAEFGSLEAYLWSFVDGRPLVNMRRSSGDAPAETEISRAMSRDLRQRGFTDARSMSVGIDFWSQTIDATIPRY